MTGVPSALSAHSRIPITTGTYNQQQVVTITIPQPNITVSIETPVNWATVGRPFHMAGWAADLASPNTVGVIRIHLWAYPTAGGDPILVGTVAVEGSRPDVAAAYGARYLNSGWAINAGSNLPPGTYAIAAYAITPDFQAPIYNYVVVTVQ